MEDGWHAILDIGLQYTMGPLIAGAFAPFLDAAEQSVDAIVNPPYDVIA